MQLKINVALHATCVYVYVHDPIIVLNGLSSWEEWSPTVCPVLHQKPPQRSWRSSSVCAVHSWPCDARSGSASRRYAPNPKRSMFFLLFWGWFNSFARLRMISTGPPCVFEYSVSIIADVTCVSCVFSVSLLLIYWWSTCCER